MVYWRIMTHIFPSRDTQHRMSDNVINTLLGGFCKGHPNICLFANGKLDAEAAQDFLTMELPTICRDWAIRTTRQTVPDFVDAYWIARCIVKHETEHTTGDPEPLAKCVSCHYIIQEVPNVTLNCAPNGPFWLKLSVVIDDIKKRIRPRDDRIGDQQESVVITRDCPFKQQHANIVRIGKGELKPTDGHDYYDACDEMMALVEVWANVTFQDSPLEQYLFGENRCSSSEHRESALNDICETYWLIKAWLTAIDDDDDAHEDEDKDIKDTIATARRMCDKTRTIDERLGDHIDLCYFCEYRARVRNVLKEKFKFSASVDGIHDAFYGVM